MNASTEPKNPSPAFTVRVRNFRSIRDASLVLGPGLNVLVGPNGSGKTNFLSALKFIRDVLTSGVALAMGRAGGVPRNYYRGSSQIELIITGDYDTCRYARERIPFQFSWQMTIAQRGPDRIPSLAREGFKIIALVPLKRATTVLDFVVERLDRGEPRSRTRLLHSHSLSRDLFKRPDGRPLSASKVEVFKNVRKHLARLGRRWKRIANQSVLEGLSELHPRLFELTRQLTLLDEYNIQPDAARRSTDRMPEARMEADGSGLSEVVHALVQRNWQRFVRRSSLYDPSDYHPFRWTPMLRHRYHYMRHEMEYQRYYSWRREPQILSEALSNIVGNLASAVNSIERISTEIDPTNARRYVVFHSGHEEFLPIEVSDGTIKWLCLLVSLFVPFSRTYLLEEPENFLHPWMQQRLIEIMREQAKQQSIVFVVSTHSATVINAVHPEELHLFNYSDGSTRVSKLKNISEVRSFLEKSQFGLGDLWVSGGVGGVPSGQDK